MGKLYKVLMTDDNLSYQRYIKYYMADYVDSASFWSNSSQESTILSGSFAAAINAGKTQQGGDNLSPLYSYQTTDLSLSTWYPLAGVPTIDIAQLPVGTRFYFTPQIYVRVKTNETFTQYGHTMRRFNLQYVKNGIEQGTINRQDAAAVLNTWNYAGGGAMGHEAYTLIPYNTITIGGTLPNVQYTYDVYYCHMVIILRTSGNQAGFQLYAAPDAYSSPAWLKTFFDEVEPIDEDDPYQNIPDSEPSGPAESTGIPENDPIDIPAVPTVSVSDTGFITLFNPTLSQVKDLANYMWTGLFDLATYKKIFADPMDCLLGFNMLPVAIPHGTAVSVRVGNISTGIQMNPATSQWVEVDCGSLSIGDAFGNYLSYAPYTKFSMYLPYVGMVELSTDDVVGKTLSLVYHVDVLSCACVAYLKCGDSVLYQFTGSCGYSIPVSGNDFRATIANIVSITATVAGAVVTGGAAAGITAGTTAKAAAKAARMKAAQSAAAIGDAASISKNVMGSKPEIHRSGAIGGSAGILGMQKPFLIVEYPNPCKPKKQYHYTGYPSFVTVKLDDISGYAEFEEILIEGVPCTEAEQTMIKDLCKGGIFL